jgi:phosphotransferase system enzyme I (PtsI)
MANIELPDDCPHALDAGATGVGLFRSEFLFMGRGAPGTDARRGRAVRAVPQARWWR